MQKKVLKNQFHEIDLITLMYSIENMVAEMDLIVTILLTWLSHPSV
jgi:hypothetical protein